MNVRDFECRSYESAIILRRGHPQRTICNNTVLERCGLVENICLHDHAIVLFFADGTIVLNSCGYRTVTAKDRINRCLPWPWLLYQENSRWYLTQALGVRNLRECVPFVDGMTVPGTGTKSEAT